MSRWQDHFDELSGTRYRQLVGFARLLTGERESAEDLVHDALIRVFSRTRRFTSIGHAEAYVKRAMVSIFIDGKRRESTASRVAALLHGAPTEQDPATAFAAQDEVGRALRSLSPRERACVVLRYYDDLSIAQVAESLNISIGATKRYLGDGREKLAATFGAFDTGAPTTASVVTSQRKTR